MKDRLGSIIFRTTAGRQIGYGHLRRCLSLAEAFRRLEVKSVFLVDGELSVVDHIMTAGFEGSVMTPGQESAQTKEEIAKKKPVALVVDSYTVSASYLADVRTTPIFVAVLDDLADRDLPVDLIMNGAAGAEQRSYRGLPHTQYLLGCRYALLRAEFAEEPKRTITKGVQRVLISIGGADPRNLTPQLVRWMSHVLPRASLDVVIGPMFGKDNASALSDACSPAGIEIHSNPKHMRALMLGADLGLTAGGQTVYELAATGTPAIGIRTAMNQTANLQGLRSLGTLLWAGDADDADLEAEIKNTVAALADDADRRAEMSERGRVLVDGQGSGRVAQAILEMGSESNFQI